MRRTAREWWDTQWFAAVAILLVCVPLLWPAVPPLTDLPGHIGRYRMMLDGGIGPLAEWYRFHWRLVGNMGADLIVAAIGPLTGPEPAAKLVTILTVALTATGCLWLSRVVNGRISPFALFALPLVYNHPFHTGFLNFALAMALALNALALWLTLAGWRWRGLVFVPVALAVWTAHVFGWAVLGLLILAAELARTPRPRALPALWPLAAPLVPMLAWRAASGGATFGFVDCQAKLLALLMAFRDRWLAVDVATLVTVVLVLGLAIRARVPSARPLAWGSLALLAAFIALPSWLFGSAFADMRLAPWVLIVALLALGAPRTRARAIAVLGLAFMLARLAATTVSLTLAAQEQERALAALDRVPVGARILLLASPECADPWRMARLDHLGGLALARRRAFANDQWPDIGASLMTTRHPAAGAFASDPSQLLPCDGGTVLRHRLAGFPRAAFDYVWLVGVPDAPRAIPGAIPVWRDGDRALYRVEQGY